MRTVTIQEACSNLTQLVEEAAKGDAFIIAEAGKPLVKVIALEPANKPQRRLGTLAGRYTVPDDFDEMGWAEEVLAPPDNDVPQQKPELSVEELFQAVQELGHSGPSESASLIRADRDAR